MTSDGVALDANGRTSPALAATPGGVATSISAEEFHSRTTNASDRWQRRPGMGFEHDVLLALIMAVAMAATVLLYR